MGTKPLPVESPKNIYARMDPATDCSTAFLDVLICKYRSPHYSSGDGHHLEPAWELVRSIYMRGCIVRHPLTAACGVAGVLKVRIGMFGVLAWHREDMQIGTVRSHDPTPHRVLQAHAVGCTPKARVLGGASARDPHGDERIGADRAASSATLWNTTEPNAAAPTPPTRTRPLHEYNLMDRP